MNLLDCTLRDGGYYNSWDFSPELVNAYIEAMAAAGIDIVEIGFRSIVNNEYKGAFAYASDDNLGGINVPTSLRLAVMVNASELIEEQGISTTTLEQLFPNSSENSPVDIVRIACHHHEYSSVLPAAQWLKSRGYVVGFNIMQIVNLSSNEIIDLAQASTHYPIDVLYFADSMGSMSSKDLSKIISSLRTHWRGDLGIHAHDNMGLALNNTLTAIDHGVSWVDSTVTGMGRGPGNTRTEELSIEVSELRGKVCNMVPMMTLIRKYFRPMQRRYGWGTNPYYYLAGKYGIHPTYIQEMLNDSRYSEEDILAVIEHLRVEGGIKFNLNTLDAARHFFQGEPRGCWNPVKLFKDREVMLLGTGPGVDTHRKVIERYIRNARPVVMALNTQTALDSTLIDVRVACHPVRLLADCEAHTKLSQPLITPASMIPEDIRASLLSKELLDYGLIVQPDRFDFSEYHCVLPNSLVIAYALAVATSGRATRVLMAGFDGYGEDDPRNSEMNRLLNTYFSNDQHLDLIAVTPTRYDLACQSIYGLTVTGVA